MSLDTRIDKEELYNEIVLSKSRGELTPRALAILMLMVGKCTKSFKHKYRMDKEDCMASAYEDILRYWKGFKPEEGKEAFGYYSSLIYNGMCKGYNKLYGKVKSSQMISLSDNVINL
jgi:hypothetical protein